MNPIMNIKLIAHIEAFNEAGYIAYIDSIKGMVVQGATPEEARCQLLISLRAKIAYDYGVDISIVEQLDGNILSVDHGKIPVKSDGENEINLQLS